ncbi:MAG TPA: hypothetical protein DCM05_17225 [Elusimicrobia bacterium]|nr:hypothetical protein [Elusimicrobiota bacterium]
MTPLERSIEQESRGASREALPLAKTALQSLGQAVKLRALYNPGHPVPTIALQECRKCLAELFARTQWRQASFALTEGRWLVNGAPLGETHLCENLAAVFQGRLFDSVDILAGVQSYELESFCELAAAPLSRSGGVDVGNALRQKGVVRIRVESLRYSRSRAEEAQPQPQARTVQSPVPQRPRSQKPPAVERAEAATFSSLLKGLVEGAVSDPQEQARIYGQAVKTVKQALEQRVAEQTRLLKEESQRILAERQRTEQVLDALGEGKVVVDSEGRVLMMDPAAEKIVGKRLADLAGKPIQDSINSGEQMISLSLGSGSDSADAKVDVMGIDEVTEAFRSSMAILHNEEGRVVGTYGVLPSAAKYKEAAKLQEDFISQVTHELKAPLASICSALELVERLASSKLGADEKRFLDITKRNSLKLGKLIDEMLDFSKLQAGQMPMRPGPTEVSGLVQEAVEGLRPWASTRGLRLDYSVQALDEASRKVLADPKRAVQILTNLVANAIKSTSAGGSITVSASPGGAERPGFVVFCVQDTGAGIAKEDQERIFQKFVQVVPHGQRREGVGLGLSIVKDLVSLHKGELWVESEPGKGAAFRFTLPVASAA